MIDIYTKIFIAIISYLLGSIPFSYLIAKRFGNVDISTLGSQNIGARNALEVTNKKWIGAVSLILDVGKGLVAVLIGLTFNKVIDYALVGALFAVLGHNFSLFMKFKGGRGLATAAGSLIYISPLSVLVWIASYFLANIISKNIHIRSVTATISAIAATITNFPFFFWGWHFDIYYLSSYAKYYLIVFGVIIIIKHINPIKSFIKNEIE